MNWEILKFIQMILRVKDPNVFFTKYLWEVVNELTTCVELADRTPDMLFLKHYNSPECKRLTDYFKRSIQDPKKLYCSLCEELLKSLNQPYDIFETFKLLVVLNVLDDQDKLSYKNKSGRLVRIVPRYLPVAKKYSYNEKNIKAAKKLYSLYDMFLASYGDTSIWDIYTLNNYYVFDLAQCFSKN